MLRAFLAATIAFQCEHHLVNRGRADAEIFLHVCFGWGPAVQPGVESQIPPQFGREGGACACLEHAGAP